MTDTQIIQTLKERNEVPTIPRIISEFHIGYQMARRIWQALRVAKPTQTAGEIDLFA